MKTKQPQKDLTLIQLFDRFGTDEKARLHLEKVIWPNGVVCPHCKCNDKLKFSDIKPNPAAKTRAGLRWCSNCKSPFTVTVGTVFEDSKIPLRKWLIAWYLICSSKKGISSLQIQRLLELGSYRTALFLCHRIRHALKETVYADKLSGIVEADEAQIGGMQKRVVCRDDSNKVPVVALVQRGGGVRSQVMPIVNGQNLKAVIKANVKEQSEIHSDKATAYKVIESEYVHETVNHSNAEFSRRKKGKLISTCAVENYFSLIKRGITGVFHHVSAQHLPLYLAEFEHRYNCRKISDGQRTDVGLTKALGKRLIYKTA